MSFHDGDSGYLKDDRFAGYDRFEFIAEKQSFFANPASGISYRVYGDDAIYATYRSGPKGEFAKEERIFDVNSGLTSQMMNSTADSSQYYCHRLEIRRAGQTKVLVNAIYSYGASVIAIRGLDMIRCPSNRNEVHSGLTSNTLLAARVPIWKDSDRAKGVVVRVHIRQEVNIELRDLLILAASDGIDRSAWLGIAEDL
ncbi:MAG: hypothetical protein JST51_16510 [Armatimonadetes bacterium]|nr:hypothetical protein [Armatimonadota bacterium]